MPPRPALHASLPSEAPRAPAHGARGRGLQTWAGTAIDAVPAGRRPQRLLLPLLMLLAGSLAQAQPAPARSEEEAASRSSAVAQTVVGILSYARWPNESDEVRLCVIGPTEYADELLRAAQAQTQAAQAARGRRLAVQRLRQDSLRVAAECDAVYAGALTQAEWRELGQRLTSRPVLSISERSDLCTAIGMFCLDVRPAGVSFEVNLDSVARSGVRIHPRVLHLARRRSPP